MKFIVTARKWRPQLFKDVVGQQHISTTLKNAIESDRVGHAYIFAGPRGVGKTTTARILAKRLNCNNPNGGEPCNECDSCQTFLKAQSLDIIEIDGASNRRIDEIRTLRESVKYAPTSGKYKVYIIDEVHMLTTESFNALLKTLEEPPEHTIFIFATTDIHKVPLTIISRCQRFDFRRIEITDIKTLLKQISEAEKISIDDESLTLIAKKADGALRDAESIFDQVIAFCGNDVNVSILKKMLNLIDEETYFETSDAILNKNFKTAFEITEKIYSNGWNFIDYINGLIEHFRNISTVIITNSADYIESSEILKKKYLQYADQFSKGDLLRILAYLSKVQNELKGSQNQKLKVEITLTHLIGLEKTSTITDLLKKKGDTDINFQKKKVPTDINTVQQEQTNSKLVIEKPPLKKSIEPSKQIEPETKQSIVPNKKRESTKQSIELDDIKKKWDEFKQQVTSERFTLGPLLGHCIPNSLSGNTLNLAIDNNEDLQILNREMEFLKKKLTSYYNVNLDLKLEINKNASPKSTGEGNESLSNGGDEFDNHPLILSIKKELGGREIK